MIQIKVHYEIIIMLSISSRPSPLVAGPLTQNPAFIVPVVLLVAVVIIILTVVGFIKFKK